VSAEKYNTVSQELQTIPFRLIVEWGAIFLPMLFHTGGYGIYIWLRGKSNVSAYPWVGNWLLRDANATRASLRFALYWLASLTRSAGSRTADRRMRMSLLTCGIRGTLIFFVVGVLASFLVSSSGVGIWNFLCKWGLAATVQGAGRRRGRLWAHWWEWRFSVVGILIIISFRYDWHPFSAYLPNK